MSLSLAAIMSEQRLERERNESRRAVEEDDIARAIALSISESNTNNTTTTHHDDDDDDESASLALALQLQAQFEHEDESRRQRAIQSANARWNNPLSKVQVLPVPTRLPQRVVRDDDDFYDETDDVDQFYEHDDDGANYDDESDEEEERFDPDQRPQMSFNQSRHTGAIKHESKHGSAVTNARNARIIGDFVARSGDMSTTKSGLSNKVVNQLNKRLRRNEQRRVRRTNREDIATVDHVLDKHTRLQILNLLNAGTLVEMHGVIATGKESNVYHATGRNIKQFGEQAPLEELAVKIFSVTATVFKDRQKYMDGERRFTRNNLSSAAARKFIRVWAEKEMRNLVRVRRTGIACPQPLALRDHVLVMTFVGRDGAAAPKLRDVQLSPGKWSKLYKQTLVLMRRMFHDCKLVHSDLSAYNLLYDAGELVVIDLSHAISSDNDNASQFLRDDVLNVTRFFADRGAKTLAPRIAFCFIVALDEDEVVEEEEVIVVEDEGTKVEETVSETASVGDTDDGDDAVEAQVSVDVAAPSPDDEAMLKMRARCEKRAAEALKRANSLVKREGVTARFQDREWTARDEAFLHEHLPRSLAAIEDETLFSVEDLSMFDLLVKSTKQQDQVEQEEGEDDEN
jgi:serine/threonine-protein kinase RIO1